MPNPNAHIHEPISVGEALRAWAAWKTMTAELVNPTNTVTKPAMTAEAEKSLSNTMRVRKANR
jgi:hypothetical protein